MTASPLLFDRVLHQTRLDRAAPDYASADFLKRRAAEDVVMRLETILRRFPVAVDLGSRNGAFSRALAASDASQKIDVLFEADLSARMLGIPETNGLKTVADEERLPFGDDTLDLAVSTLSLHWTNDLVGALIQIRRALRPDGLFIGAIFGGATLTELRQALLQAEDEVSGGASFRVSPFADAIDAAGLLQRAGFALPVADVDRVKVRYGHPIELLRDLRRMGETSVLLERSRKPMSRRVLMRAMEIYVERFAEADGRVPATFEIVAVTGWAPHENQQKPLRPGSAKMRLADALGTLEEFQSAGEKPEV
jgi:SAM-dependent methyltransferase